MNAHTNNDVRELTRAVARMHAGVLALVCGTLGGLGLFLMTAWLIVKGGPNVGAHLQLLSQYLWGYSVTWPGSLLGLIYGALVGGGLGWLCAVVYNRLVGLRHP